MVISISFGLLDAQVDKLRVLQPALSFWPSRLVQWLDFLWLNHYTRPHWFYWLVSIHFRHLLKLFYLSEWCSSHPPICWESAVTLTKVSTLQSHLSTRSRCWTLSCSLSFQHRMRWQSDMLPLICITIDLHLHLVWRLNQLSTSLRSVPICKSDGPFRRHLLFHLVLLLIRTHLLLILLNHHWSRLFTPVTQLLTPSVRYAHDHILGQMQDSFTCEHSPMTHVAIESSMIPVSRW